MIEARWQDANRRDRHGRPAKRGRRRVRRVVSGERASRNSTGWLNISDQQAEQVQRWLWNSKDRLLSRAEHLTVEYVDLNENPAREIDRIIEYLNIAPDEQQRAQAIAHVEPNRRQHRRPS